MEELSDDTGTPKHNLSSFDPTGCFLEEEIHGCSGEGVRVSVRQEFSLNRNIGIGGEIKLHQRWLTVNMVYRCYRMYNFPKLLTDT